MSAITISAMLQQAVILHQQGQYDAAEDLYHKVLQVQDNHFDALHLLGVLARQRGDPASAVLRLKEAIAADPQQPAAHSNLGAALQDLGHSQEALVSYALALQLKPDYAIAWNNRGNALRSLGQMTAALHSYDRALQIQPDYPEALLNRGIALQSRGEHEQALDDFELALEFKGKDAPLQFARAVSLQFLRYYREAIEAYQQLLQLDAGHAEAWFNQGICLQKTEQLTAAMLSFEHAIGLRTDFIKARLQRAHVLRRLERLDDAIHAYQQAAAQCSNEGELAQINFALAALGVTDAPAASPAGYVADLFDQYAGHFDQHLLSILNYQVPELLALAVNRHRTQQSCASLDLGCGTGLCGPYLRPYSATLVGVDLSANMLAKARKTGLYDELHCQDITDYLQQQSSRFDLVLAADVFVYIGELTTVFAEVSRVLHSGGLFGFSVETASATTTDYTLAASQRYTHTRAYLHRLASEHGFVIAEEKQENARRDKGEDVLIHILVLSRQ